MCRIGVLFFERDVGALDREEIVCRILENGYRMGNRDGVGLAQFSGKRIDRVAALTLYDLFRSLAPLRLNRTVLLHARLSTNRVDIHHTQPLLMGDTVAIAHNGVVSGFSKSVEESCQTKNDSERIAAAYLLARAKSLSRAESLKESLEQATGLANVLMLDSTGGKKSLLIYPDSEPFLSIEGDGWVAIVQEERQVEGLRYKVGGTYPAGKVYEWDFGVSAYVGKPLSVKRPKTTLYSYGAYGSYYHYATGAALLTDEDKREYEILRSVSGGE